MAVFTKSTLGSVQTGPRDKRDRSKKSPSDELAMLNVVCFFADIRRGRSLFRFTISKPTQGQRAPDRLSTGSLQNIENLGNKGGWDSVCNFGRYLEGLNSWLARKTDVRLLRRHDDVRVIARRYAEGSRDGADLMGR